MASDAKVRKQAASFVRSLSESLLQDVGLYYEAGLKEGFSECIAAMPEGKLKQELITNVEQYCTSLMTAMKKQGRVRLGVKGHTKKQLRKAKSGASKGQSPRQKVDTVEGKVQVNALTEANVEESLLKVKRIGNFEDRFENYCTLARACSTNEKQLQSVLLQWQDELCGYEEEGRCFPQLMTAVQFCLLVTAGFGMKAKESYTLVWLQFCVRIFHHLVHLPRGLSPDELAQLGDKMTNTIAIAKLRISEDAGQPLCEQLVAILSLYIEVAMSQTTATSARITTLMHLLLGSSPVHYLDVLLAIPLPPSHETAKRSLLYTVFRYALRSVHRTQGCKQYAKFAAACSLCLTLRSEGQSQKEVREIALEMTVPDGFVKTICSTSPCLAERTGIRLGIKPKQVASLLLRSLDDRSRADLMELFDAEMKGEVGSPKQQHFGEEVEQMEGEEEEVEEEEEEEEKAKVEEEDGSDQISPIIDFLDMDLGQTVAEDEGESVWMKKASIPKEDGAKPGAGRRNKDDFPSVENTSSDSTQVSGNKQLPQREGRRKRPGKEQEASPPDDWTDRPLDCGQEEGDQGSSSTQRHTNSQKRMSLRQRCLPPISN